MITAEFNFPDLLAKLEANRERVYQELTVAMQTNRGMLFLNEGAYNGHDAWAPLKFRVGQILADRGVLKSSLAPPAPKGQPGPGGYVRMDGRDTVVIGTNVAYAKMMNYGTTGLPGGVLRPKNGKALRIPIPSGPGASAGAKALSKARAEKNKPTGHMFVQSVKIPARRFDTMTNEDAKEFEAALLQAVREVIAS